MLGLCATPVKRFPNAGSSLWSAIVIRRAAFGAGHVGAMSSRFFGVMFRHLFGVMLSHLFKEGGENMAATPA